MRYRAGIVTDEMLSMPKTPFLFVGLLEALGAATGMAAGGDAYSYLCFSVYHQSLRHFHMIEILRYLVIFLPSNFLPERQKCKHKN